MQDAIIVDIDGTLSDPSHRKHFIEKDPKDWKGFLSSEEILKDGLHKWCSVLIDMLWDKDVKIILLTGRSGDPVTREATKKWLNDYGVNWDALIMRPENDYRSDTIIKQELYEKHIKDKYNILFALEDRKQVAHMWRCCGITCLHCAEGDY